MKKAFSENVISLLIIGILLLQVALSAALLLRINALTDLVSERPSGAMPEMGDVRVEGVLSDDDPDRGPDDAPVTIVAFSDFQCPACATARRTLDQLMDTCGGQVRLVFRDFPLGGHGDALRAAIAAECAHRQGQFWLMHDLLFGHQQALAEEDLLNYARQLRLDEVAFADCLTSEAAEAEVRHDLADGQAYGVNSTPTLFVNGRRVRGAPPSDILRQLIDEELARAGVDGACR